MFNICAILRDNNTWLKRHFLPCVEEYDKGYSYYIYENDSVDGTKETLRAFASTHDKVDLLCENNGSKKYPRNTTKNRVDHLSRCRNKLLSMRPFTPENEWTLIIDSDIYMQNNIFDKFIDTHKPKNAVAISCNGKDKSECQTHMCCWHYYDVFAMVDKNGKWMYSDFKLSCNHFYDLKDRSDFEKGRLVKVNSAFGGATFYRTAVLNETVAKYACTEIHNRPVSEHIVFNEQLRKHGHIYVDPNLIVLNKE